MGEEKYPFLASVRRLVGHPKRLLITLVVGNEIVNITLSIIAASLFIGIFGSSGQWVAIAVTTILLLIFGESIPKTFGVMYSMPLSSFFSPILNLVTLVEKPIVSCLDRIAGEVLRLITREGERRTRSLSEGEFRSFIDAGQKEGALEEAQRDLIHRVFELTDKTVAELMVPRVEMFCLPISMRYEDVVHEMIQARHSRVPVYGANLDDILGILFARDLLPAFSAGKAASTMEGLLRKPYFVPEEKTAGSLLKDFQERSLQIAIVVDEYGGVSGLITLEDMLENLFEDLYEDFGLKENAWQRMDKESAIVLGSMAIETFNNRMGTSIPESEFDTVGGFVFHLFGKLPATGEEVSYDSLRFKVEVMGRARILKVRVFHQKEEVADE
jgi:CBS domain containing-hemolysin-like protein